MTSILTDGDAVYRRRRRNGTLLRAAAFLAAVAVSAALFVALVGLPATLDGATLMVRPGTTAEDVLATTEIRVATGDLLAAKDRRVIGAGQGAPAALTYRGSRIATDARLLPFRAYGIRQGSDVVEPTRTETKTVDPPVKTLGKGSEQTILQHGRKGVSVTVYGAITGDVLSSEWIVTARPQVVQRYSPTSYPPSTGNRVRAASKIVALTFDDGPDPTFTPAILKILKDNGAKATFFMLSPRAERSPALARRVAEEGHLIANHSRTHRDLRKLKAADLAGEFRRSQEAIASVAGAAPRYFRAPYGAVNSTVTAEAKRQKLQLVGWAADSTDWKKPGVPEIVKRATPVKKGGVIVLLHDSGGDRTQTIAALPEIIRIYRERGYRFVTVDEFYR